MIALLQGEIDRDGCCQRRIGNGVAAFAAIDDRVITGARVDDVIAAIAMDRVRAAASKNSTITGKMLNAR